MTLFSPTILGDKGKGKTGVASEPELKGNVEDLAIDGLSGGARRVLEGGSKLGKIANHVGISELTTGSLSELVPDMEPVTVVFVTNF
jgi:hypothetical protein